MDTTVNVLTLRRKLGEILDRAARGDVVRVTRQNKPLVKITADVPNDLKKAQSAVRAMLSYKKKIADRIGKTDSTAIIRYWREHR